MSDLLRDLRFAARALLRRPGFTLVAVVTLALGLGANLSIFSLVDAVLLRPPPLVRAPERLVSIWTSDFSGPRYGASSYPDYEEMRGATDVFAGVAAYTPRPFSLGGEVRSSRIFGEAVSANYFDVLGVRPALGRFFAADEDGAAGGHPVAVLGYGLWRRSFGGARDVVGRVIRINGRQLTVIGVAPEGFSGSIRGLALELWLPFSAGEAAIDFDPTTRGDRGLFVLGRLRPGVAAEQAQARMDGLARQLQQAHHDAWTDVKGQARVLTVLPERLSRVPPMARGPVLGFMALLMATVGAVLLIACANVANLLLARATGRQKEVAIRLAIGGTRGRLIRQLLVESLLLALLACAAGVALAAWINALLMTFRPPLPVPIALDLRLDPRVLTFGVLLAAGTAVLFGLAPALRATRPDLVPALKDDAASPRVAGRRFTLRNLLVVGQVAGSLVLLVTGSLFLRSLRSAAAIDPGFDPDGVVLASFGLGAEGYDDARALDFYRRLSEGVASRPGVSDVALAKFVPLALDGGRRGLVIDGYQKHPGEDMEQHYNVVGPGYFEAMRTPLVRGRGFTDRDRAGAPLVAVVNETFARRFWPGQDPIGQHIGWQGPEGPRAEVVGVARDGKYGSVGEAPMPYVYIPVLQDARITDLTLHVRAAGEPGDVAAAIRRQVRELDAGLPIANLTTLRDAMGTSLLPQRVAATLLGIFGALALLLAAVGLHGVLAFAVGLRTRELGIRMAIGARAADVRRMVLAEGMTLVAIGAGIGLVLAFVAARLLGSFLLGVGPGDPLTFLGAPLLLGAVALLAAYVPARRATRIDPVEALRSQ